MEYVDYYNHGGNGYYRRHHVPAFGSWNWDDGVPFTQCFESARQAGLLRYSYSAHDQDLYVAGDLYANHVVTPAMIVVPRRKARARDQRKKVTKDGGSEDGKGSWKEEIDLKEVEAMPKPTPKPVDEDLYKISPELLYSKPRKKRGFGCFSGCFTGA